jgi:hypothetical protein
MAREFHLVMNERCEARVAPYESFKQPIKLWILHGHLAHQSCLGLDLYNSAA